MEKIGKNFGFRMSTGKIRGIKMAILATLLGCQGTDEFRAMIPAALNFDVTPMEIKEIVYR